MEKRKVEQLGSGEEEREGRMRIWKNGGIGQRDREGRPIQNNWLDPPICSRNAFGYLSQYFSSFIQMYHKKYNAKLSSEHEYTNMEAQLATDHLWKLLHFQQQ